jgi:acetyltransferase-like isoleucine patch superfamily enzyme
MKSLLEKLIRLRNPMFRFSADTDLRILLLFSFGQLLNLLRGFSVLLRGKRPRMLLMGRNVTLFNAAKISWGRFLRLGDGVLLSSMSRQGITLGNNVSIGAYSRLVVSTSPQHPSGFIRIGHCVGMGEFAYLGGTGGLEIGDECIIGQYFSCHPENHIISDPEQAIRFQGVTRMGIRIGSNCWIGSKVTILDGVQLGEGCVIAAGAVVKSSFPPGSVVGGVPARLLRNRYKENITQAEPSCKAV